MTTRVFLLKLGFPSNGGTNPLNHCERNVTLREKSPAGTPGGLWPSFWIFGVYQQNWGRVFAVTSSSSRFAFTILASRPGSFRTLLNETKGLCFLKYKRSVDIQTAF